MASTSGAAGDATRVRGFRFTVGATVTVTVEVSLALSSVKGLAGV